MHVRLFLVLWLAGSYSVLTWSAPLSDLLSGELAETAPTLNLTNFIASSVEKSPRVLAAQAALNASKSLESAASRPLYNPEVEFEATDAEVETRTVGISQTFDFGNKRTALTAIASADVLAAEAEYRIEHRAVVTELLLALSAYQTGRDRDLLATERADALQEFLQIAQQRRDSGDLSQSEYNLASLLAAQARLGKAVAASELSNSVQQIHSLVSDVNLSQLPTLDFEPPAPSILERIDPDWMSLPEVQAARLRADSASAVVELRKRERRPDPTISLVGGKEGEEQLVGITLSMPIPIRNSRSAEVDAASETYQQAWLTADNAVQRSRARLNSASERYRITHSAWSDWQLYGQSSLDNQTTQLRLLWQAGELSTSDFLVQMSQTIDSGDSALALRQTLWDAWFEWLAASNQIIYWISLDSDPDQF